jgi:hypothetical protein
MSEFYPYEGAPPALVDLNELDALAGEWRSVHNLLMEAAVHARRHVLAPTVAADSNGQAAAFAAACEAVATRLSNP